MGRHVDGVHLAELDAPLWEPAGHGQAQASEAEAPTGQAPETQRSGAHDPASLPSPNVPGLAVRHERLLVPEDFLPELTEPPAAGWRRAAWRAGARWLGPGPQELRHREWARMIRRPLPLPRVIAVMSPKGGVGTSTTAIMLGQVLALLGGQLVVALDASPDWGNLVARVPEPHSALGAGDLFRNAGQVVRHSDLAPYLTRNSSGLCVVRSDRETDARLGPAEYRTLIELLARFYSVIVVDLGTGIRDPAFLAVIEAADAVVPVTEPAFDAAEVLVEGLDWLSRRYPEIIRTATAVISRAGRGSRGQDADQIAEALEDWVAQVVPMPCDPHLAGCWVPRWESLRKQTRDGYLELAATVIDALPDGDALPGEVPDGS